MPILVTMQLNSSHSVTHLDCATSSVIGAWPPGRIHRLQLLKIRNQNAARDVATVGFVSTILGELQPTIDSRLQMKINNFFSSKFFCY
jgi:hypothetical protein